MPNADPFLSDRPVVPPGKPLLEVEDLHKSFGALRVLKGITTTILKGEVVVVIGPSGGGKSTFLRCLNLLETPTSGRIWFGGEEIVSGGSLQRDGTDRGLSHRARERNLNRYRSDMGMVFQRFNLFPHMTVLDNVTMAPRLICCSASACPTRRRPTPSSSPAARCSASRSPAPSRWSRA